MVVITDSAALGELCRRLGKNRYVTVDTEFIRDTTYWPELCLVQLAGTEEAAVIDALAPGLDLAPLGELMARRHTLKVLHAARQDFEIFYRLYGRLPNPVFDTQIAAMVCGFGDSVGYETLVKKLARAQIDKSMRFTDWRRRPLSAKQLDYALADVTHLRTVYEKLSARLERTGRAGWLAEEMAALTDPAVYRTEPREAWRRLKVRSTRPRFLAILRELAAWRETEAQRRDVPRNRILRDDALVDIAAHAPNDRAELAALRSVRRDQTGGAVGKAVLDAVAAGRKVPEADCPRPPRGRDFGARPGRSVELLKVLLKMKCETHDVAQKLVASTDDIEAIARDDEADVPALHGWRRQVFGEDALALKHGRLALTADGPNMKLLRLES